MANRSKASVLKDAKSVTYRNEDGKEVKIPEADISRWTAISELPSKNGFNKFHFIDKMTAGYMMDAESTRRFLVVSGLNNLRRVEEIMLEMRKRVTEEKRTMNEDELNTLKSLCSVMETVTMMSESIIKISGAKTNSVKGLTALPIPDGAPDNTPSFYKQEVHIHTNGQSPPEKSINIPSPDST